MKGFVVENQQTFSKDEVCRMGVTILVRNSREERFHQEVNLTRGLAQKRNHETGNHHKEVARLRIGASLSKAL
jgi:hypothetical protein